MGGMVVNRKVGSNQGRHTLGGPDIAMPAMGFGPLGQQGDQLSALGGSQFGGRAGRRVGAQGVGPASAGAFEPLADRALGHTKSGGDGGLFPARLGQRPGLAPAAFAPRQRRSRLSSHGVIYRKNNATLDLCAVLNSLR